MVKLSNRKWFAADLSIGIILWLFFMTAMATSRVESAVVTESNGVPCFSIPADSDTKNGLPFYGIMVTDGGAGGDHKLPDELWSFTTPDLKQPMSLRPTECIRYGEAPLGTNERTLKPLELYHAYYVIVMAQNRETNVSGFSGQFCIKPGDNGKRVIQTISNDRREGDERFNVCRRP